MLNAAAYTAVDKAETRGGPGGRLGGQRVGPRRAGPDRHRAPPHAGALLHRLRLRRHGRGAHRGRAATRRSGSTRRPRRPATSRSATTPRHYLAAHVLGDRRRPQLRAHHAAARRRRRLPDRRGRPGRPADVHLRAVPRHQAPLDSGAPYGVYNVSDSGPATSWADLAREVFRLSGRDADDVTPVTTEEYVAGRAGHLPAAGATACSTCRRSRRPASPAGTPRPAGD